MLTKPTTKNRVGGAEKSNILLFVPVPCEPGPPSVLAKFLVCNELLAGGSESGARTSLAFDDPEILP
jgi:hypothetical protein